jgi:hypothetical protein
MPFCHYATARFSRRCHYAIDSRHYAIAIDITPLIIDITLLPALARLFAITSVPFADDYFDTLSIFSLLIFQLIAIAIIIVLTLIHY